MPDDAPRVPPAVTEPADAPVVSVVVLSYNYGRFLRACLDSILRQEGGIPLEVIVVDDASTDDSAAIAASYGPPVRLIRHAANHGHAATVTDGLRAARGAYIARIDCDDRYRPEFLRRTVPCFTRHPAVGLVYGDAAIINEDGAVTRARDGIRHGGQAFVGREYPALLERNFICSPTVIARREAWLAALPIPPHLVFHDWYFTLMIARRHDLCYLPEVLADYRVHPANYHARITREKTEEASIRWLLDHCFSTPEQTPALEARKRAVRRRVYGTQLLSLADKYFGCGLWQDARRCYLTAGRHRPRLWLRAPVLRRFFGTLVGPRVYERGKAAARRIVRRTATTA